MIDGEVISILGQVSIEQQVVGKGNSSSSTNDVIKGFNNWSQEGFVEDVACCDVIELSNTIKSWKNIFNKTRRPKKWC
jgi:hypothetical protein